MFSILSLLWALFLSSCISLRVWRMSDICFPGIFFWQIFFTAFRLFCSFGGGGSGGRKGSVGLWWLSHSAGSFLPISHLLMVAILPRPSVYNIQDMIREIGYLKQLTALIVSEECFRIHSHQGVRGGGRASTLSFCVTSCKARGQYGSQYSLCHRFSGDPAGVSLCWIQSPTARGLCSCDSPWPFLTFRSMLSPSGGWNAERAVIPWNFSFPALVVGLTKPHDHLGIPTRGSLSGLFQRGEYFGEFFLEAFFHDALGIHL